MGANPLIADETYLDRLDVSVRLLNSLKNIIAYDPDFEGRREMTFGTAKSIPIEKLGLRPNVGAATVEEWDMFLKASTNEEAARNWSKETLRRQIAKYEKALVNYKRGIETQERRLAELRAQLETIDD
jgi:hypoxanthine phosphoribosyltransferase